jgi:predicted RNA binding protein with dsRBD fold (UPF0201 family)
MSISTTSTVQITEDEKRLLLELINAAEEEAIHGLDHTDTRSFKTVLRRKLDTLESLRNKLQQ